MSDICIVKLEAMTERANVKYQIDTIMKKILLLASALLAFTAVANADDRPVTISQLPVAAQTIISEYYPADKLSYAKKDDDFFLPDYNVVLVSGVRLTFGNSGALKKIETGNNLMPEVLIPVQLRDYVKTHYPDVRITEYEIERRHYDVKLSNRMELKFNRNFILVGIDD